MLLRADTCDTAFRPRCLPLSSHDIYTESFHWQLGALRFIALHFGISIIYLSVKCQYETHVSYRMNVVGHFQLPFLLSIGFLYCRMLTVNIGTFISEFL